MKTLIIASLILSTAQAYAGDMHKCEVDGKTTYQDTPCAVPDHEQLVDIVVTAGVDGTASGLPSRDNFMKYNYTPDWQPNNALGSTYAGHDGREIKTEWFRDQFGNSLVKTFTDGKQTDQQFIKASH